MADEWVRVGAYVRCVDNTGRILLTRLEQPKNPRSGAWTMPGGVMEFGEQPARLLLVAHHWVVDGVSWRILLQDLLTAYNLENPITSERTADILPASQRIENLPAKTASFQVWASHLSSLATVETIEGVEVDTEAAAGETSLREGSYRFEWRTELHDEQCRCGSALRYEFCGG